ncbi:hypothetical protein RCL1_001840 [Eukaryota sp. TZLM3-RCL]
MSSSESENESCSYQNCEEPPVKQPRLEAPEEIETNTSNQIIRYKKYALIFAYIGTNYHGSQIQNNALTVESVLQSAFLAADLLHPAKQTITASTFTRAARTDKGVSAAANVCALSLREMEPEEMISLLNSRLPSEIRVLRVTKVTPSFNARRSGTARRYEYMFPVSVLAPKSQNNWAYSDKIRQDFENLLQNFVGVHNFYNFTSDLQREDPKCKREILSISVGEFNHNNVTFLVVKLYGRSFLLHQIRKMIGTSMAVFRSILPAKYLTLALTAETSLPTPKAPAEGLLLDGVEYEYYAEKYPDSINSEILDCPEKTEFKTSILYPSMLKLIQGSTVFTDFLESVDDSNFSLAYDQYDQERQKLEVNVAKRTVKMTAEQILALRSKKRN